MVRLTRCVRGRNNQPRNPAARVIVKAVWEHGSLGLGETSVMRCADAPRVIAARNLLLNTEHFAEARPKPTALPLGL